MSSHRRRTTVLFWGSGATSVHSAAKALLSRVPGSFVLPGPPPRIELGPISQVATTVVICLPVALHRFHFESIDAMHEHDEARAELDALGAVDAMLEFRIESPTDDVACARQSELVDHLRATLCAPAWPSVRAVLSVDGPWTLDLDPSGVTDERVPTATWNPDHCGPLLDAVRWLCTRAGDK